MGIHMVLFSGEIIEGSGKYSFKSRKGLDAPLVRVNLHTYVVNNNITIQKRAGLYTAICSTSDCGSRELEFKCGHSTPSTDSKRAVSVTAKSTCT